MLKPLDEWDLLELSRQSDVSRRAIRFYQQEGLLKAPGVRGRTATYGPSDLRRLKLIKALQRKRGLSLPDIRDLLESLDDQELSRQLDLLNQESHGSGADYARAVRLQGATRKRRRDLQEPPTFLRMSGQLHGLAAPSAQPRRRSRDTWERIVLTPDIELHVREPLSHRHRKLVLRLVELADRLLHSQEDDT